MPLLANLGRGLRVLCWLMYASWAMGASAHTLSSLKAAYVYNIVKFTHWPDAGETRPDSPLRLCLYGGGEVIGHLEALGQRSLGGRTIQIRKPQNDAAFTQCQALYISAKERRRYRYLLSLVADKPVLTISDDERFLRDGGLINLKEEAQRLRFEVSMEQLSRTSLQLSSKLLQLAILIESPKEVP